MVNMPMCRACGDDANWLVCDTRPLQLAHRFQRPLLSLAAIVSPSTNPTNVLGRHSTCVSSSSVHGIGFASALVTYLQVYW